MCLVTELWSVFLILELVYLIVFSCCCLFVWDLETCKSNVFKTYLQSVARILERLQIGNQADFLDVNGVDHSSDTLLQPFIQWRVYNGKDSLEPLREWRKVLQSSFRARQRVCRLVWLLLARSFLNFSFAIIGRVFLHYCVAQNLISKWDQSWEPFLVFVAVSFSFFCFFLFCKGIPKDPFVSNEGLLPLGKCWLRAHFLERDADHLEGKIGSRWKDLDDLEFESGLCQNLERKKVLFEWYGELKTSQLRKIELVEEVFPAY